MDGGFKVTLFSRLNIEEHHEAAEQDIEQIITSIQVQKVKAITRKEKEKF